MSPELSVELRPPLKSPGDVTVTSSSGRSTGSEFSRIWWKREKIAVFAPIPSATESTTVRLSRGAFARLRQAKRSRAISLYTPRRAKGDLLLYEQRYRHAEPDGDDDPPHRRAPHSARRTRPADSAQNRPDRHDQNVRPVHHMRPYEVGRRHSVDAPPEHHLEAVHLMDVVQPQDAQRRQHEDPDARPEVAAVNGHSQLKPESPHDPPRGCMPGRARRFQQARHRLVEDPWRRPAQQQRARDPAHQARYDQDAESRLGVAQLPPVAPGAAQRPRPDGHRAGGVRRHRTEAQPDKRREGDQRPAAGYRVDGAGQKSRAEGYHRMCQVQVCNFTPLPAFPELATDMQTEE